MFRSFSPSLRRLFFLRAFGLMAICSLWMLLASSLAAEAPSADVEVQVRAHLASGEFSPALRLARGIDNTHARDELLGEIAAVQGTVDRRASLATISEISDDRERYQTLDKLGSQPTAHGPQGGTQADFESLIELITSTVHPESWDEVGGPGAIDSFEGGVYVDAQRVLRRIVREENLPKLTELRASASPARSTGFGDEHVRRSSNLRKVSLPRLEKQIQLRHAVGQRPTEAMQRLAGLQRVEYVFVYPEEGEIVLAGPAGDWKTNLDGQAVSAEGGRPVLHLDDLVVLLRHALGPDAAKFGCSITPTQEALARTQAYLDASSAKPLKPGQRDEWLAGLRQQLGRQEIDVFGIDPRTRVGRVLVEADYHMKLIGMGLAEGTLGVTSYLDSIVIQKGAAPPPMEVLRWWFTLNYSAVQTTTDRQAFSINGQGVKVLSENELLTELGERVHTGKANELNAKFAHDFTKHFAALASKYPVYGELRNIFDLALVAALIKSENLADQAGWHAMHFGDPDGYQVELAAAPEVVESVINHRVINRVHVIAGVSGGVSVDARPLVKPSAIKLDTYGKVGASQTLSKPKDLPSDAWWWD